MTTSNSVAQIIAQTAAELDDAFELPDPLPKNVYLLRPRRPTKARPTTIAECVPLMAVATEFLRRGPDDVSIAGVEAYRTKALELAQLIISSLEGALLLSRLQNSTSPLRNMQRHLHDHLDHSARSSL